ncbi:sulfate transporter family-domain-containing protein [Paraphysoderma sedebokerense]|nr:sulfate transporter family-domain-containing protein [Paraphysoderma sedebokerense]
MSDLQSNADTAANNAPSVPSPINPGPPSDQIISNEPSSPSTLPNPQNEPNTSPSAPNESSSTHPSNFFSLSNLTHLICVAIPILNWLPRYPFRSPRFPTDLIAGITLSTIIIPQGMAYAVLAKLPPVYGLYASAMPVLIYCCFGSSMHMSTGPFAITSLVLGEAVTSLSNGSESNFPWNLNSFPSLESMQISIAMNITLLVGILQLILSVFRLGSFTSKYLLPPALTLGFTTSCAFHIATSQVKPFFGLDKMPEFTGVATFWNIWIWGFSHITSVKLATTVMGISCVVLMVVLKWIDQRWKASVKHKKEKLKLQKEKKDENEIELGEIGNNNTESQSSPDQSATPPRVKMSLRTRLALFYFPIPDILIAVIITTLISYFFKTYETWGIGIIGPVPLGLPPFSFPPSLISPFNPSSTPSASYFTFIPPLLPSVFLLTLLSTLITFSVSSYYSTLFDYKVYLNQELFALGLSSTVGSFFGAYVCTGSLTRSALLVECGASSMLAPLVGVLVVVGCLVAIAGVFEFVPKTVLAAVIVVSMRTLLYKVKDGYVIFKQTLASYRHYRPRQSSSPTAPTAPMPEENQDLSEQIQPPPPLYNAVKDFLLWWVTFISVIALNVQIGMFVGLGLNFCYLFVEEVIPRTKRLINKVKNRGVE